MKPDRSNYEIWLIDWLDGNLDSWQIEQLISFLEENPDIKEEADTLAITGLKPDKEKSFKKELVKKTTKDLTPSQIEYLSVACLENDLTPLQGKELEENISQNREHKRIFDLIQKTRLKPIAVSFRYKNKLTRETREKRIIRLTITTLSAAATIAILVLSFITLPRLLVKNNQEMALITHGDTILLKAGTPLVAPRNVPSEIIQANNKEIITAQSDFDTGVSTENENTAIESTPYDSVANPVRVREYLIARTPEISMSVIDFKQPRASLIASNITVSDYPLYDDGRGRISRFIASAFREKVLKVEKYNDSPIKSYEIAEAGIDGLNKLLGWEMALVKTTDEEGQLKSLYFSSKVLRFNSPVKKDEPSL